MMVLLLSQVHHAIEGVAPARHFAEVTGLSQATYRRSGYKSLEGRTRDLAMQRAAQLGIDPVITEEKWENLPRGLAARLISDFGWEGARISNAFGSLCEVLEAAEDRFHEVAVKGDYEGMLFELSDQSALGGDYCSALDVTHAVLPHFEGLAEPGHLTRLITRRTAHMTLSLLAAIDLELGHFDSQLMGGNSWSERARFGALVSEPERGGKQRLRPRDPVARLVDLIAAFGYHERRGRWPDAALSIEKMGLIAELNQKTERDGARFVRNFRNGKSSACRKNFRRLIESQTGFKDTPESKRLSMEVRLRMPYLFATHALETLMAPLSGSNTARDRRGWRAAYYAWWHRHEENWARRPVGDFDRPPLWLDAG